MEEMREDAPRERREMPNAPDAERAILGSMMMDNKAILDAMEILSPDDFYNKAHALMYESILELNNEGAEIDGVTLQDRMRQREQSRKSQIWNSLREFLSQSQSRVMRKNMPILLKKNPSYVRLFALAVRQKNRQSAVSITRKT